MIDKKPRGREMKEQTLSDWRIPIMGIKGEVGYYPEEKLLEFIKKGDKIFYADDYGNDEVNNEKFSHAIDKWEEFKELAGSKLVEQTQTKEVGK